jgi:glutamate-ammonia-ligase adenylyltransferase
MIDGESAAAPHAAPALPEPLRAQATRVLQELAPRFATLPAGPWRESAPRVIAASDFVAQQCQRTPELLGDLVNSGDLARSYGSGELAGRVQAAIARVDAEDALMRALRVVRQREMVRIAWRDLAGWASLNETLGTLSELADACLDAALGWLHAALVARHGMPRAEDRATPQQLVVLGMGKLGGRELNFSSDIDLIFCYPEEGSTEKGLSNHEFFVRLGQALIRALNENTADGFVFRVDMRLRPNGASGPLALSFDAMEHYYQTHGREWERYALLKARVVAGDRKAGAELLARLKPFVFRKYLDFGAIESIRAMKAMIAREVERRSLQQNIKLGPGGIREIEFIAQALQLIRAGREPQLQEPALLTVLPRLADGGHITGHDAAALADAYVFLRNTEHRLQMMADRQTQVLPQDDTERARLAFASGFADWPAFDKVLARHRRRVDEVFAQVFTAPQGEAEPAGAPGLQAVWLNAVPREQAAAILGQAGYGDPPAVLTLLDGLRSGGAYVAFSAEGRARMDKLMPLLLGAVALTPDSGTTLARIVQLIEAIGRRSTYLALLVENPMALSQLVKLCAASPWIASWIASHPILLDELLDPASLYAPPDRDALRDELRSRLASIPADDLELQMEVLREYRHGNVLRVAASDIGMGLAPEQVGAHLAWIAEAVIGESLALAHHTLAERHGEPWCPESARQPGFAVIGYGKLGSLELGYASDLDIIFLYEGCGEGATDGERSLPNETFFARLGQRLIHILTTRTPGGILYEVDMRLRPSGKSGPLVASLATFETYQRETAWTWEQQALVRARPVAGDPQVARAFMPIRDEILRRERDPQTLRREVAEMRARMAESHPGARDTERFDLKHDRGGIVDIEFMVQYWVLRWAHAHPALTRDTDNIHILQALVEAGLLAPGQAESLANAYRRYLSMEHRTKLMERGSEVPRAELGDLPGEVQRRWRETFEE